MITIGIIGSTGSLQGDQVLRGVYGRFTPGDIEGGVGKFQIAPEFGRISHLFTLLDGGQSPVSPQDLHTIEVDESQEHLVKAQLMHAMATRWSELYARVSPSEVGLLGSMIGTESANVSSAAKNHLVSMGMRAYLVPVTTGVPGSAVASERELMTHLCGPSNITIADGAVVDLGTDPLVSRLQQPARDAAAPVQNAGAPAPQWIASDFNNGVVAQVSGSIMVLAPSIEAARQAADIALRLHADNRLTGVEVEFIAEAITGVRPLPAEAVSDLDDSDFDPDFDDRGDRDRG